MFHKDESFRLNQTSYITSEIYHALNRNSSDKYIRRSTSSLFYDLDTIAKRHSYHFIPEHPPSDNKIINKKNIKNEIANRNGFVAKSEAIVQECATQIQPKLARVDSLKISTKKMKKRSINDSMLSSEIFLKDNDYTKRISDSFLKNNNDLKQKIWSYAKYKTEYTNPIAAMKKCKKKDQGKRIENPCPCQLFSYACPCTDKKSLTELAKNSKSLTVADQITSTTKFSQETRQQQDESHNQKYVIKIKKSQCCSYSEDKPTNITGAGFTNKKYETTAIYEEPLMNKKDNPKPINEYRQSYTICSKNGIKVENKCHKKPKLVICPNCKEKLEIFNTDDEGDIKLQKSPHNRLNESLSPADNVGYKNHNVDESDVCFHDPPCELVPVCQILPTDNVNYNMSPKCVRRVSLTKHNPKMIKITKACRHHPPCLVVPSCQRLNVLKNNCEYVPPCLHRPRCVNVPLCVSYSKNLNYDNILNKRLDHSGNMECSHYPPCNMKSSFQQESLSYANQTCEYFSEYSPRLVLGAEIPRKTLSPTRSPCNEPNQLPCTCCRSNKSCQYDCVDCKCVTRNGVEEYASSDDVIYIRDVGCQFKSDNFNPQDSLLHSKTSSASFDITSAKAGAYYSNYHTLRYEDKCTNPISGEEASLSTFTTSSLENEECSTRGVHSRRKRTTGFSPQSAAAPFVAFSTCEEPILQNLPKLSDTTSKSNSFDTLAYLTTFRRGFVKGKHKKVYPKRRRKKSRRNNALK